MGTVQRALLIFNQTLVGQTADRAAAAACGVWSSKESQRVARGDYSHLPHWALHVVAVGLLFWFISGVCGFPWWQYCLLVAYPGMSLGLLRAFHRASGRRGFAGATASVESNVVFGLLYLYNNLHVVHHLKPTMPWYDIPRYYRENQRRNWLERNGISSTRGYGTLAGTSC